MDTSLTENEPIAEEIRSWDEKKLLEWVQKKLSIPLDHGEETKFITAKINGSIFLNRAGTMKTSL